MNNIMNVNSRGAKRQDPSIYNLHAASPQVLRTRGLTKSRELGKINSCRSRGRKEKSRKIANQVDGHYQGGHKHQRPGRH